MDRLAPADLDRFLRGLARRVSCPVRLVLTGGGEAMVLGGTRPTGDLDSDVEDLRAVLRRQRVPWRGLVRLCGESLRTSPRSTQLRLFRQQVEHFLGTHGVAVWGPSFDPERAMHLFRRAAGIPPGGPASRRARAGLATTSPAG